MALSDNERYTMKLKALKMLYQDNYSQTEIAQALNISRVTLNKLIEEAKKDGMVRVDIIDIRDTGKNFSVEIELYKRFNLKNVVITDCTGLDEDQTNMRIARNAADIFDRYISNNMSIGVTWGRTMKTMGTMISERQNLKNIVIYSMVGGVSNVTVTHATVVTPITIRSCCHASSCGQNSFSETATTNETAIAVISLHALIRIQNHRRR